MTADRARAHENYGIAAKPTIEERLSAVEKLLGVTDIAEKMGQDWVAKLESRMDRAGIGELARAVADIVEKTMNVDPPAPHMPKPLPCPFCGGTPYISTSRSSHGWETKISCAVDCCPAEPSTLGVNKDSHSASAAIAIERWNKRA